MYHDTKVALESQQNGKQDATFLGSGLDPER